MVELPAETPSGGLDAITEAVAPRSISYPDDRHLHIITDEELESLKAATNQLQAGVAVMSLGVCLTSLPSALPAINGVINGTGATAGETSWLAIFLVTLVLAVVCGINGFRRKNATEKLAEKIRSRSTLPLAENSTNHVASET